jgi:hypothetical protein
VSTLPRSASQDDRRISLEGELVNEVHINTAEIPDFVRDNLAAATLDLIHGILRQPGGREALDAKTAARKAAVAAK